MYPVPTRCAAMLAAVALAGCADRYATQGFDDAAVISAPTAGSKAVWVRTNADEQTARKQIDVLRAKRLTAGSAVEIVLVSSRASQAALTELGFKAADLAEVSRPSNPDLGFKRRQRRCRQPAPIGTNVLNLLTRTIAYGIESCHFEAAKLRAAAVAVARSTDELSRFAASSLKPTRGVHGHAFLGAARLPCRSGRYPHQPRLRIKLKKALALVRASSP